MSPDSVGTLGAGEEAPPVTPRWIRPVAIFAVGFVITTAFQTQPGPGLRGAHLVVTVALVVLTVAAIAGMRLQDAPPHVLTPMFAAMAIASAVLVGVQPNGPGFLGVFPAVSAAALRLPNRHSAVVLGVAVVSLAVGWTLGGQASVDGIVLNELGVLAMYILSMFARRYRESNERSERLIVELEESRGALAEAAALGERQRLAREMHDVLAHSLSGLVLNLESARLLAERDSVDPEVVATIDRAHHLAKTGLQEARRAISMLRGDELPGPQRLAALAAEFEDDSGVKCTLDVTGSERELDSDGRLTLYRVAQEALTNTRKHARAQRVELHLAYEVDGTRLTIEDVGANGDGRPPPGDGTGYGLTGMRERAALLGGTLTAEPTDAGFRVELWVPA